MKTFATCCAVALLGSLALAQAAAPAAAGSSKNPVTDTVRQIFENQQRNLVAAAEQMPADKYTFHPTEGQNTYAQMMAHIATSNAFLCQRIGDQPAPDNIQKVKPEDGKDKIVAAVKDSFAYCAAALKAVDDSKLGDEVPAYRNTKRPRAWALIALTNDFADHYSAAAGYLRAAGMLPPSAQRQQQMQQQPAAPKPPQ
jgi:uncharacterized damage-inducible protein DinB